MMQVQLGPVEPHLDPVPAPRHILVVQRLVDVADEVHDELGRDGALVGRERAVEQPRGVVGQRRDDAPRLLAVALEVDVAVVRRRVVRVDEVEGRGEAVVLGVAERVGPGRDAREVVRGRVAEEGLQVEGRRGGDEGGGEVGDGYVAEAWGEGG